MIQPPIVMVEWEDAYAPDVGETWVPRDDSPVAWKPYIVRSVGFLLQDGPEGVILTESVSADLTGQRQQIPRGMIRAVIKIRPAAKRNAKKPS